MPGIQSPPAVGVDLLSKSFQSPNVTFAGKTSIFELSGSGGGSGGVPNVNGITSAVNIINNDGSVTVQTVGSDIILSAIPVTSGVSAVNGISGSVGIVNSDGSISVQVLGTDIVLSATSAPTTVNALGGAVLITSPLNTLTVAQTGQTIELEIDTSAVVASIGIGATILQDTVSFTSTGGTVLFTNPSGSIINFEASSSSGVTTLNSIAGAVTLTSPNSSVAIAVSGQNIELETVSGGPANILAGTDITITATEPTLSVSPATILINATGGAAGLIGIQSDPGGVGQSGGSIALTAVGGTGVGGLNGSIQLTADPGTELVSGVVTGGSIEITANTGLAIGAACSVIKQNAAAIQSFAGAIPVIPTLTPGFNSIYGNQGISMTAGLPAVLPQVPFTIYQYASAGISLDSDVYTNQMYPYWPGVGAVPDLTISGRILPSASYVVLEDVKSIDMASTGAISGVVTINGSAYPPASAVAVNSLNSLTGAVTLSAGTNITLATVGNDIAISSTVTVPPQVATANVAITVPITAITQATSQTIVNTTITTTATQTLCITGMITFDTNTNTKHDISVCIKVNTVLVGQISTSSLDGIGHFITVPAQATDVAVVAGPYIVSLEAFADTASVFQALTYTIQVLAI